ncbi:Gfra1 [Phodopus roborovskii]|uniref:Gfra1 protein n=1 Tax=Phodopus roborovskii TaxID=109678 RepID=A0AAU9ZXN2_PHORO|nr:Gfra1 [Phodopus roborovskii]
MKVPHSSVQSRVDSHLETWLKQGTCFSYFVCPLCLQHVQPPHGICFLETPTQATQEQPTVGSAGFSSSLGMKSLSRRQHMPFVISYACGVQAQRNLEHISKGNNCLDAAKACNLDDTCKKYRSAYITPCTTSMSNEVCNRRKCHKALRQFFDKVPAKHSYGMLFCSCRDIACTERRRQTIVPVCSYEERDKPNCLNLQDSCKTNYICTVMTPNYIDSSSLSVAPWCDCTNSGNDLDECLKFLNFFKDNTCLKNAIQAFGNGSDVTMWQPALPVQTTTATTTTAFRVKNKPAGPAGSENEIPTHVLPPCANLQHDYEQDGLAGASSHITIKSMAAPPSCGQSSLQVLVVTTLATLLSVSLAETS